MFFFYRSTIRKRSTYEQWRYQQQQPVKSRLSFEKYQSLLAPKNDFVNEQLPSYGKEYYNSWLNDETKKHQKRPKSHLYKNSHYRNTKSQHKPVPPSYNFREPTELNEYDSDNDCSMFPNNTYSAPFAYACGLENADNGPPIFVVHEAAFSNETGDYVYPLDFTQKLRIFLDLTSYATRRFKFLQKKNFLFYFNKTLFTILKVLKNVIKYKL